MRTLRNLLAASTIALLAAACGNSGTPVPAPSTTTAATTTAETSTSATQTPAPTGTLPADGQASTGAMLTPTNVRVGHHDGFDRVVIDLGGTGTPGWVAEWTTDPVGPGSGEPIDVSGDSVLRIRITGAGYPGDTGAEFYSGPNPVDGTGVVTEVHLAGIFEGESEVFIGVDADQPSVRITVLTEPTRLVIDIAN